MRNYTLNTIEKWGVMSKFKTFTLEQIQALVDRKYRFSEMFQTYRKTVANFTEIVLDLDKNKLYFYRSRFFTPAELDTFITNKEDIKKIKEEVKWLKGNNFFTQKR